MSYKAPRINAAQYAPEKPQDPLINMAEMQQATDLQKNQRGMLSTYLQGRGGASRYRLSDYVQGATASSTSSSKTLGSSLV